MCRQKTSLVKKIIYKQGGKSCYYCKRRLHKNITLDHLIPKCRGGQTVTNNLVICCSKCNGEKGSMTEHEYFHYLEIKKLLTDAMEINQLRNLFLYKYSFVRDMSSTEIIKFLREYISIHPKNEFSSLETDNLKFEDEKVININDVVIFSKFKNTPPSYYKIKKAINYYNIHKKLDKPLTIIRKDKENILVDGYARYIALQRLHVPYAPAKFYAIQ